MQNMIWGNENIWLGLIWCAHCDWYLDHASGLGYFMGGLGEIITRTCQSCGKGRVIYMIRTSWHVSWGHGQYLEGTPWVTMIFFISPYDIFYTILMLITGRIDLPNIMFFPITMYIQKEYICRTPAIFWRFFSQCLFKSKIHLPQDFVILIFFKLLES